MSVRIELLCLQCRVCHGWTDHLLQGECGACAALSPRRTVIIPLPVPAGPLRGETIHRYRPEDFEIDPETLGPAPS
jgi:hypothetical protein